MSNLRTTLLRVLLAAGLSFALWAFVSFSQNPEATVTFPDVPLQAVGLEPGLVIVDINGVPTQTLPSIDITLSTDQQQLAGLRPVDIRAVADLSGRGAGEHIIPVNVQPTRSNLSFTVPSDGAEPSAVPIRLEAISAREVPIEVAVRGNLPFSFERGEPAVSFGGEPVAGVEVRGPESRVERVAQALAAANIEQLRATYLAPLTLVPVDAGGVPVEGVALSPATVTVEIPINPVVGLKLVPVQPQIVGLPAPGFELTGVLVEPPLIAVTGGSGRLDAVGVLTTAPIEIGGARDALARAVRVVFPDGTSPNEGEPEIVRVTIQVAPIALPFQAEIPVPVTLTGLGPGLQFGVSPAIATVTVQGTSASIGGLAQTPLRASVDATGLGPGVYQLPLSVALPPGVSLVGDQPSVEVTLRLPPSPIPSDTPEPSGTPEPTDTPEPLTDTPEPPTATPEPFTATPEPPPSPTP